MQCPKCGAENRDEAKFCGKCRSNLSRICPQCNSENPPDNTFCDQCGYDLVESKETPLKELSFDEKIEKIQKYLPKGLTDKILSQRDKIEGERKQVTVMFCDLEGFTPLVERLGAEEAYSIMDEVYEILIHKVHDYEGTVNEMTGDGIMALFGAPIALEDAPQRAIRSAYAIHREMTRFSEKVKQEKGGIQPLKMRIGIHTGPVIVGTLGNDLRVEFKAVGDTVNLASRMEDLAEPGATYLTEETFKLTEGFFRFEALGEREVKGKEEPVKTFRVIGPSTRRTRFDVSAERGLTPFVGRERELELLLDGYERAKQGRGQSFSIMSDAGVGKSRLLYELTKAIMNEDVTILQGKCLSYSRGVAYHPIIDLYKSNFDIRESETDYQIKDKVIRGLKKMGVEEASTLPYLLELLSVKDSGIDQIPLSPEARKDRMIDMMIRIPLKGSEIRPLVMAIEDLHWIDKSSEEALKYVLESISGARILMIFTYRPEFVHTWGGRSYHNQVNLNRLSNRESLTMVNYLLGTEDIENDLEDLILEKTEGVPFFIEEFIKSLKELGIIERSDCRYSLAKDIQDVTIPSTIHDVIMARVDSLPEESKEVLQTCSVIEREFSYDLIKRVTELPERDLLSYLSVLKDSELLYERGIFPKSTYIFKHALTREVVYDSILTRRKKILHEKTGDAVEELSKDKIDEHYGVLAEHYVTGENYEKGAKYSRLAARKAEKAVLLNDAILHAKKWVGCIEKLPQTDDIQKMLIDSRTVLGLYLSQMNYHVEAKETVAKIFNMASQLDYKRRLAQINAILGAYSFMVEEDFSQTYKYFEETLRIAEEVKDIVSLAIANFWLHAAYSYECLFRKAIYHVNNVLHINEAANNLSGISMMKAHLAFVHITEGKVNLGYQTTNEAIQIAEESGDNYSRANAYALHGVSCYAKGFLKEAINNLSISLDCCERSDFFEWSAMVHMIWGLSCFDISEYQESIDHHLKAVAALELYRTRPSFKELNKLCALRAKVMCGEKDTDLESLFGCISKNKIRMYDGWMAIWTSEILLNIDDDHMSQAEDWIKKAIEADERNGMIVFLGRDYALYAELFERKGDKSKAKVNLNKAIEILKECGADGWVVKYEKELAALS
jgi:predicted ATPase/class 3 adenylate cyclase/ribosomal protein L40E